MTRKKAMTVERAVWPEGYACLAPYLLARGMVASVDIDTFSWNRVRTISKTVLQWSHRVSPCVDLVSLTPIQLEEDDPILRTEIWRGLYNLGFRIVPCKLGPKEN